MQFVVNILQKFPVYLLLFLSACSVILGDFFAKYWSTNQKLIFYILALIAYFFSGFFYIPTLLKEGLIITAVIWSLLGIVGFLFIGLVIFKEPLTSWQKIGVFLGIISLIILSFKFN